MGRLNDKIAIISGAAGGIGAALATSFVREGAFVYVTDFPMKWRQSPCCWLPMKQRM